MQKFTCSNFLLFFWYFDRWSHKLWKFGSRKIFLLYGVFRDSHNLNCIGAGSVNNDPWKPLSLQWNFSYLTFSISDWTKNLCSVVSNGHNTFQHFEMQHLHTTQWHRKDFWSGPAVIGTCEVRMQFLNISVTNLPKKLSGQNRISRTGSYTYATYKRHVH